MEIEIKQIKELMAAMERCGMTKMEIKEGKFELNLERSWGAETPLRSGLNYDQEETSRFIQPRANAPLPRTTDMTSAIQAGEKGVKEAPPGKYITSPMVGTFYPAPAPGATPYVKVGDYIEEGQIVCIIEAMKVMNEIKAKVSGTVVEILVEASHPVEFGAKIFRIQ